MRKLIELGVTSSYWHNWDTIKGISEVVSNAIDNCGDLERLNIYKRDEGKGRTYLIIENDKTLPLECLLIGKSYSRNDSSKIGMWGEGLKACALIFCREEKEMIIELPDDKIIIPKLIEKNLGGVTEKVLAWYEDNKPTWINGTRIKLETNIRPRRIKNDYLMFKEEPFKEIDTLGHGCMFQKLKEDDNEAFLYIKGKKVCKIPNGIFSYNLYTDSMNRDRNIVDSWELKSSIGLIMKNANTRYQVELILATLRHNPDSKEVESFDGFYDTDLFKDVWNGLYGEKAVLRSDDPNDALRAKHKGFDVIKFPERIATQLNWMGIQYDKETIVDADRFKWVKTINSIQRKNLKRALELFNKTDTCRDRDGIEIRYFSKSDDEDTIGIACSWGIGLRKDVLNDLSSTLKTLGHELVHFIYGTIDNSNKHDEITRRLFVELTLAVINETGIEFEGRIKRTSQMDSIILPVRIAENITGDTVKVKLICDEDNAFNGIMRIE